MFSLDILVFVSRLAILGKQVCPKQVCSKVFACMKDLLTNSTIESSTFILTLEVSVLRAFSGERDFSLLGTAASSF